MRWPPRAPLFIERGELLQDVGRLRRRVVQTLLRRLLAAEDILHLLFDRISDGGEVAEPDPLAVRRHLARLHLSDRRALLGVLGEVAGRVLAFTALFEIGR